MAWGTGGKGSGGPRVSLAMGPRAPSVDRYGAGYMDLNVTEPRQGKDVCYPFTLYSNA